ncbi:hypothetical protein ACN8ZM_40370 (plasmid) [Burkholderia aenigmatica]|uniref:hypothetical protein n=1 Tax=Burkholderia aenigmatica TaxID=2015348 RepID=UPI003B433CA9
MNRDQQRTQPQRLGRRHVLRAEDLQWTRPIEEDLFMHCASVFTKEQQRPKASLAGAGIRTINDLPFAAGLLAVMNDPALKRRDSNTRAAIWWRLVNMLEIAREPGRLAPWVSISEATGATEVSEGLVRACAKARLACAESAGSGFDTDDLATQVAAIDARDQEAVAA